jgi:hypothetical protein
MRAAGPPRRQGPVGVGKDRLQQTARQRFVAKQAIHRAAANTRDAAHFHHRRDPGAEPVPVGLIQAAACGVAPSQASVGISS